MPKLVRMCAGLALGLLAACSDDPAGTGQPDGGGDGSTLGNGTLGNITPAANGGDITSPFDATPDPSGKTVYFTAISIVDGPGVFSAPATGGTPTKLFAGDPFASPFGIAITADGKTLYVADSGAAGSVDDDNGRIFVVSTGGGQPTALAGPDGYHPRSLEIAGSDLYFTGVSAIDGKPGVFRVPLAGGTVTTVGSGAPFVDPSGIAVASGGVVYVMDTVAASGTNRGVVIKCTTTCAPFADDIRAGYPAGIAVVQDESAILVSALDPSKGTDVVYRIETATKNVTTITKGIDQFDEPAGLHRAPGTDVYAWADSKANGGTVFVLTK